MADVAMEAKLVAVSGAMVGDVFSLDGEQVSLGRDIANSLWLPDASLSRRHCLFVRQGQAWDVQDLGSSNGTFVNGLQVTTHRLQAGDRITIGDSTLLFVERPTGHSTAALVDTTPVIVTSRVMPDDTSYLQRAADAASRTEHGLRALLAISTVINQLRSEEDLYRELLKLVCELAPASDAAIVLVDQGGQLTIAATAGSGGDRLNVSRTVVRQVMTERAAVLGQESGAAAFQTRSLTDVLSLLCVPLAVRTKVFGAIYLAETARAAAFDDEHLQLVTAVGRIAASAIDNLRHAAALQHEADRLHADLGLEHQAVGSSPPMRAVYDRIARIARADTTVLVTGETGTGKELAARAVHFNGSRARRPFIALNCATLSETLLESELFGYERGAFTGAVTQKKGKLELADGGTLFLDEVGELAPPLQSKLLRFLQEREFERVGGTRPIRVDIRLISATNRTLQQEVRAGRFREDLYFRLNVVQIQMPPLRERRSDIPLLVRHFLNRFARKAGRRVTGVSAAAMACLAAHDWPGNVRELENVIERAAVLGSTEEILPEDLPETILDVHQPPAAAGDVDFHSGVAEMKKRLIVEAFGKAKGSYVETARLLGLHPNYLHRLIRNLGLKSALES
jgi:Nif-specific regulatory protein